jgi:hypothetical protein
MYHQGYSAALQQLGIEKIAFTPLGWAARVAPKFKNFGKGVVTNLFGQPKNFVKEWRAGKAFGPNSLMAEGFKAPKLWQKGLMYGLPAASAIQTMRSDDPDKAGTIGGLLGATALGTAAFGPLGMIGSLPASYAGEYIGKRFARGAQRMLGVGNQATPQYTSLQNPVGTRAAAQLPGYGR